MNKFAFALAAVTIAAATPATAATVIDQGQATSVGGFAFLNQSTISSQSFKAGYNNSVGAGVFLASGYGSTGRVTVSILTAVPGSSAQIVATGTANGTAGSWVDVSWAQTALVVGQTYWLSATSNSSLVVGFNQGNSYANGDAFYGTFSYAQYGYDLTFRTYANNAVAAVPEPATWGLMIAGFGMVGFGLRRRAKISTAVTYA